MLFRSGQGYGAGAGQAATLTPEKQEIYQKLVQDYAAKVDKIRADLVARQSELDVLNDSANPDQAKIAALAKDVGELHAALITEQSAFRAKVAKDVGLTAGGYGCPGYGGGYGRGAGPSNCAGYAANCPGYGAGRGAGGCPNAN